MFELVNQINYGTVISVDGETHKVQTKTLYYTVTETENWYAKFVFEDHSILVIAPFDDFMYFGRIKNIFGTGHTFEEKITFNGAEFKKDAEDYQIVKQLVFGDPLVAEGEVSYADYVSDENEDTIISLAVVSRTKERADVVAHIIGLNDIMIGD